MKSKIPVLSHLSQQKLTNLLQKIPGKKDLIIDPDVIRPLENIVGILTLKSLDVEKIFKLLGSCVSSVSKTQVFLIFGDLILAKHICDHINSQIRQNVTDVKYHLIVIPRKLYAISHLLEEEGVYEYITTHSFQWELIPLENLSVLSLELPTFFGSLFVHGDQSLLPVAAKSLWSSFILWGNPDTVLCIGDNSAKVVDLIDRFYQEIGKPDKTSSNIDCFLIIDRDADYPSTMLTPATYAGLLDEVFGIQSGFVELNQGLVIPLKMDLFQQIKNRHFSHVSSFLKDKARTMQAEYDRCSNNVEDIKRYVKQSLMNIMEQKKSLSYHITACEMIIKKLGDRFEKFISAEEDILELSSKQDIFNFVLDYMAMEIADKYAILRVVCLLSLLQNGLTVEESNRFKTQFLHQYGYHLMPMFYNLEKLGLFMQQTRAVGLADKVAQVVPLQKKGVVYNTIQRLKLKPPNSNMSLNEPADMSYVFSGSYIPLACQLVNLLQKGEISKEDMPKIIPKCKLKGNNISNMKTFLVYFVGGVTYAEIAAFQLLEKLTGCQILVCATNIINGNSLCRSCE